MEPVLQGRWKVEEPAILSTDSSNVQSKSQLRGYRGPCLPKRATFF